MTLVTVTHDSGVAGHAGRIVAMKDGRVVRNAGPGAPVG
jgi:predicted ABC-type transport system involved in lysophospholipase L1 biosynthesis ATPase subunit